MNEKVRHVLASIIERFKTGDIPKAIALSMFPIPHIPAQNKKIKGELKSGQDPFQEITAELSAAVLCRLVGKSGEKYLGLNYKYIETYAQRVKKSAHSACLTVMSDTEKVLNLILVKEKENVLDNT